MNPSNAKIVGTRACPTGLLLGHDADSLRANLGSDGRVSCVICGTVCHDISDALRRTVMLLPLAVRAVIAALISSEDVTSPTFKLTALDAPTVSIETLRVLAATAQDVDGDVFARTRVALAVPPYAYETLQMDFSSADIKSAEAAHQPAETDLTALTQANPPFSIMRAALVLVKHGYELRSVTEPASYRSARFRKSDDRSGLLGINAVLNWVVQ